VLKEQSREEWRMRAHAVPISDVPRFVPDGLVLGAGTVLIGADGARGLKGVEGQEARLLALLSAAYGRAVAPSALRHLERASKAWSEGDDCLAYIHLAHACLGELQRPREAAQRLVSADAFLKAGGSPRTIFEVLRAGRSYIDALEKDYNPSEPRVPAGSGKPSGEWTRRGQAASGEPTRDATNSRHPLPSYLAPGAASWLGELSPATATSLGEFAATIVVGAGGAAATLGLIFIPTPNNVRVEGDVAGVPGLHYSWNRDETQLQFSYEGPDGERRTFTAQLDEDVFRDSQGRVVGRLLPGGTVAVDPAAISSDLAQDDEPRLCPAPENDKRANNKGLAYEMYIRGLINPGSPTPPGLAYYLPNPNDSGKMVSYDDCQRATGSFLAEMKDQYAGLLRFGSGIQSVAWPAPGLDDTCLS
jgi:hypothetical protein